jgi:hypothetical protein
VTAEIFWTFTFTSRHHPLRHYSYINMRRLTTGVSEWQKSVRLRSSVPVIFVGELEHDKCRSFLGAVSAIQKNVIESAGGELLIGQGVQE